MRSLNPCMIITVYWALQIESFLVTLAVFWGHIVARQFKPQVKLYTAMFAMTSIPILFQNLQTASQWSEQDGGVRGNVQVKLLSDDGNPVPVKYL